MWQVVERKDRCFKWTMISSTPSLNLRTLLKAKSKAKAKTESRVSIRTFRIGPVRRHQMLG